VKNNTQNIDDAELFVREYNGVNSTEYFISFESPDNKILYGFLRLRINHTTNDLIYPELENCSFIRELHVYGSIVKHDSKKTKEIQHRGFGKKMMKKAEEITYNNDIHKVAIISGVGVREYYENIGYKLEKDYMVKTIYQETSNNYFEIIITTTILFILISIVYDIFCDIYIYSDSVILWMIIKDIFNYIK
jgi:elongator complex protein 3